MLHISIKANKQNLLSYIHTYTQIQDLFPPNKGEKGKKTNKTFRQPTIIFFCVPSYISGIHHLGRGGGGGEGGGVGFFV